MQAIVSSWSKPRKQSRPEDETFQPNRVPGVKRVNTHETRYKALSVGLLLTALLVSGCGASGSNGTPTSTVDTLPETASDASLRTDARTEEPSDETPTSPDPCGSFGEDFTRCEANPLYTAGNAHSDGRLELIVADPSVLYDEDEEIWKAWWQSPLETDYLAPNPKTAVLYAESPDGLNWTVQDAPAMSAGTDPGDWDFDRMETPSVIKVPSNPPERRYVMYYTGGNFAALASPFPGYPWYQVGVAFSADGRSFERLPGAESPYANSPTPFENIDGLVWYGRDAFPNMAAMHDGLVADPEVVIVDGVWHLFASSFAVDQNYSPIAFGLSHATSTDGIHWVSGPNNPVMEGQQPSVLWDGSRFEIFYNGDTDEEKAALPSAFNAIGHISHAYSTDGATGEAFATSDPKYVFAWDASYSYERYSWLTGADVVLREDGYWLFYTGFSDVNPPENFLVEAKLDWCANAGETCTCYEEDGGTEICLLKSVVTFNLARRTR